MAEVRFEEALKKLEKIVEELEGGDLSLDEALKKYQEGVELSRVCAQRLENARKKI
jgi:exodeoxyribonuclease VII small subunit